MKNKSVLNIAKIKCEMAPQLMGTSIYENTIFKFRLFNHFYVEFNATKMSIQLVIYFIDVLKLNMVQKHA